MFKKFFATHSGTVGIVPVLASGLQPRKHQRRSQFLLHSAGCGKLAHCFIQRSYYNLSLQNEVDGIVA